MKSKPRHQWNISRVPVSPIQWPVRVDRARKEARTSTAGVVVISKTSPLTGETKEFRVRTESARTALRKAAKAGIKRPKRRTSVES